MEYSVSFNVLFNDTYWTTESVEGWWLLNACGSLVECTEDTLAGIRGITCPVATMCATIPKWNVLLLILSCVWIADPNGRAVEGVGLRPVACKDCGFESRRGHGFVPVVSVVCCLIVSASGPSPVQKSPPECGVWEAWKMRRSWPTGGWCAMGGGTWRIITFHYVVFQISKWREVDLSHLIQCWA
jgi:hypothetical protein